MLIIYTIITLLLSGQIKATDYTAIQKIAQSTSPTTITSSIVLGSRADGSELRSPIRIVHSGNPGPVLSIFGAIHGDEITGTEIIRRISSNPSFSITTGTVYLIPVVNLPGFYQNLRYLPDRRDLNRTFPGSSNGSQAARLAYALIQFLKISKTTVVVDLHSAATLRHNLPQIRATYSDGELTEKLAQSFGTSVILNSSSVIDGSLRAYCKKSGIAYLLYEGGEASRIDETSVHVGVMGVYSVLDALGMKPPDPDIKSIQKEIFYSRKSFWVRATDSGILNSAKTSGDLVSEGETLGQITDLLGVKIGDITSPQTGIIIGHVTNPILNAGDPIFHIAQPAK
jgi:predicted deacylase